MVGFAKRNGEPFFSSTHPFSSEPLVDTSRVPRAYDWERSRGCDPWWIRTDVGETVPPGGLWGVHTWVTVGNPARSPSPVRTPYSGRAH